ncbi:transposase zinc-binding domain-containing protein [Sorangium sp. So ce1099]|uniref:transposase zinc-binding domain-containing protein n=1 Tax=Sorangium sp. So ce1099 TaxID=3133331 RepID=UPI003F5F6A6D
MRRALRRTAPRSRRRGGSARPTTPRPGRACAASVCPSCNARRTCNTAAHITDRVLPAVPVRQWVLSLPRAAQSNVNWGAAL